jgi:addiction module RelE/StbE family toxin
MEYEIAYTKKALSDLDEIEAYIALDSPRMARRWIQRIIDKIEQLRRFPESGKISSIFEKPQIREILIGNYKIIYRIKPYNKISILRILHMARLLG